VVKIYWLSTSHLFVLDAGASIELKLGRLSNGIADWSVPVG
jgi:hypothetical protein